MPWLPYAILLVSFWATPRLYPAPVRVAMTLYVVAMTANARRLGVTLAPDALYVHRVFGTRRVPWSQVADVTSRKRWDGFRVVEVRAGMGRRIRLVAPVHARFWAPDPGYAAKVDTITRSWHDRAWAANEERTVARAWA